MQIPQTLSRQRGVAILSMLFMAVVLAVAVTRLMTATDTVGVRNQAESNYASQVAAQANLIRSRILLCASDYPDGNNGTAYRPALPAAALEVDVSTLVCPGTTQSLWNGTDGVTYPPTPKMTTTVWVYVNDAVSARLAIAGDTAMLSKAAARLGPDATLSGSNLTYKVAN